MIQETAGIMVILMVAFSEGVVTPCSRDDDGYGGGYGSSSGSGRRTYSRGGRGGGGRGGGGGGRGGCFDVSTTVWTKNETQPDKDAKQVMANDLVEGDLVGTMDLNMIQANEEQKFTWTRATDVTIYRGKWKAHFLEFSNGNRLTVTSPHLMIIWKDEAPYFVRADQLKIGDMMKVNDMMTHIAKIKTSMIGAKVAIETEDGTIQVNGVLASGFCDDNPESKNKVMKVQAMINEYKTYHFGEDYNDMCLDVVSWRTAYMNNNGFTI